MAAPYHRPGDAERAALWRAAGRIAEATGLPRAGVWHHLTNDPAHLRAALPDGLLGERACALGVNEALPARAQRGALRAAYGLGPAELAAVEAAEMFWERKAA